jgi:hypothetical protein
VVMPMPKLLSAGLSAVLLAVPAMAAEGRLTVELNKFEASGDGACRAFFLFRNETGMTFEGFEMSLAVLDPAGVIDRLLSVDAAPLPVARTTLKLFEIPGTGCERIAQVLLHDIPACKPENADPADCFALVDLVSRTAAPLVK